MPDWRKPTDYLFLSDLPDHRRAWEFLRRNPLYRSDWNAALSRFLSKTAEFAGPHDMRTFAKTGKLSTLVGRSKCSPDDPVFYLPVEEARKWRLPVMLNPSTDEPTHLTFNVDFGGVTLMREGDLFRCRGSDYPIVEFNLRLPLKPQIDAIEEHLETIRRGLKIKPRHVRQHRKLWPRYIRLLDADLDRRTPKQIADLLQLEDLGMNESKVWDQLRAAKKMTELEGYLSIFLSTEKSDP